MAKELDDQEALDTVRARVKECLVEIKAARNEEREVRQSIKEEKQETAATKLEFSAEKEDPFPDVEQLERRRRHEAEHRKKLIREVRDPVSAFNFLGKDDDEMADWCLQRPSTPTHTSPPQSVGEKSDFSTDVSVYEEDLLNSGIEDQDKAWEWVVQRKKAVKATKLKEEREMMSREDKEEEEVMPKKKKRKFVEKKEEPSKSKSKALKELEDYNRKAK